MAASGNVRYSQIRSGDRTGSGNRIVTAASGTLTQNVPLLYDASGNVAATATRSGNTTEFATISGTKTTGEQLAFDASGNIVASGSSVGGGGGVASGPNTQTLVPVDNSTFSDLNSPSVVQVIGDSLYIATTTATPDNIRGRIKAVPTAPYTIEVGMYPDFRQQNYRFCGFCLYDGTKLLIWVVKNSTGVARDQWSTVGSINSGTNYGALMSNGPVFLRFEDDNTNWKWSVGLTLDKMETVITETRNTYLTPTYVGMIVNQNVASGGQAAAWFIHWNQY